MKNEDEEAARLVLIEKAKVRDALASNAAKVRHTAADDDDDESGVVCVCMCVCVCVSPRVCECACTHVSLHVRECAPKSCLLIVTLLNLD